MRVIKGALVTASVLGWMIFAFSPRRQVSAGPALIAPTAATFSARAHLVHQSEQLAVPTDVEIVGEYLVLVDRQAEHPIHVVDRTSGALARSLGRDGDGPGEYRALRSIIPAPGSTSAFWAYDMAHSRLTRIDLDDEQLLERPWDARLLALETPARITGAEFVDAGTVIAAGFFAEGRLGRFATDGKLLDVVGDLPVHEQAAPAAVLQHAYTGTLKIRPDRTRLAIGLRHASSIEIREAGGALITNTKVPDEGFEPVFEVANTERGPKMSSDRTLRFGYIDVAVTSDRIYGLYSGRTREGFPGRANFGDQIHVFDWSGNLLDVLELDQDLIAIAVDEAGHTLYGVIHDPAPAVLSWPLETENRLSLR